MTHKQLVRAALKWLVRARGCEVVLSETKEPVTGETPDAIGWKGRHSILIECKASRADFRRDKHKWFRLTHGLGQERLFMAPQGVIPAKEVPEGWGLLEVEGTVVKTILEESLKFHDERRAAAELPLLVIALRRAQIKLRKAQMRRRASPSGRRARKTRR